MNIVIINGSPRNEGNTGTVIRELIGQIGDKNSVELIHIPEMDISFCNGCNYCQNSSELNNCREKDDFQEVVEKIKNADLTILASPLYIFGFTAQLKRFLDRMYSLVFDFRTAKSQSYLKSSRFLLIITSLGPETVSRPCIDTFKEMCKTLEAESLGEFVVPFCRNEKRVKRNSLEAIEMISGIVSTL